MELEAGSALSTLVAETTVGGVYKLSSRVKRNIGFLQRELKSAQGDLRKIAEVPADKLDEVTKAWAADLRDVSHQIEHGVDNFRGRILAHQLRRTADPQGLKGFVASLSMKWAIRKDGLIFATNIRELKHRVKEVASRRPVPAPWDTTMASRPGTPLDQEALVVVEEVINGTRSSREPGPLAASSASGIIEQGPQLLPDTDKLVGIDVRMEELVKMLTEDDTSPRQLKVVAIVGDGPVGKTTLAKAVYHSLAHKFELAAWVTVPSSSQPDIIKILRAILRQISHDGYIEDLDTKQLIDKIRRTLRSKRYLIVVDNVVDEPEWELLKCALVDNSHGSAVLMTSRKAGHLAHFVDRFYSVGLLSITHCRELFYKTLFGSEDKCPDELKQISEHFIENCGRTIPTTIALAELLKSLTKYKWYAIYEHINSGLLGQIMEHGFQTNQYDLPPDLEHFMLYLSMFPKGCEISVEHLLWLWRSEGCVSEAELQGCTLQARVGQYLDDLIKRKLIEPIDIDVDGKLLSCCTTGIVHDLIISMSTEKNFATLLLDGRRRGISLSNIAHRISIHGNSVEHLPLEGSLSHVKSLVVSGDANSIPSLSKLQGLRVLDLGRSYSLQNDDINDIGNLFHLKCLIVGGKCITRIPEQIGNLLFLETLDLRESGVLELPESIVQVKQLKHLYVNSCTKIPRGIGKLEALQELGDINISNPKLLQELCNLTKLRILRIAIWSWDESLNIYDGSLVENLLPTLLQVRQNLQTLSILTCCSLDFLDKLETQWAPVSLQKLEIKYGIFDKVPNWIINSFQHLSSLTIEFSELSQDIICMLGKLRKLSSLSLTSKHGTKGKFGMKTDEFEQLTSLSLVSSAMEKVFTPEPDAMQMLKMVKLSFQASRTEDVNKCFSFGLEDLHSLQHVRVEINCFNASRQLVEHLEAAVRGAISTHSHRPNLEIRRVREKDMVGSEEEEVIHNIKQTQHMDLKNKKSSRRKIKLTAKKFRPKEKGVARKYKIVSLQLKSHILTLQAL